MKFELITSRLVVGAFVITCSLPIATTVSANDSKSVNLEIVNDQLVIRTKSHENDCPWNQSRDDGCIKVKKRKKADISFHLIGNTKCGLESGTKWKLNAVYLGGFNAEDKPGKFGFDNTPDPDFNKVHTDFNIADRASGRVTLTAQKDNKMAIYDDNQSEYQVWYKVEAICPRADGGDAHITTTDPRIKNGGTQ